jgi:hypothetical protein
MGRELGGCQRPAGGGLTGPETEKPRDEDERTVKRRRMRRDSLILYVNTGFTPRISREFYLKAH